MSYFIITLATSIKRETVLLWIDLSADLPQTFFLTNLQNKVFRETAKPNIYARYIDGALIVARIINVIKYLKYPTEMLF